MSVSTSQNEMLFQELEKLLVFRNSYVAWSILVAYVTFSKLVGPGIMRNRKPLELKGVMFLYNAALIAGNVFLSVTFSHVAYKTWPYRCDIRSSPLFQILQSYSSLAAGIFLVKFAELFDTVLFILRKKDNQVSFLHVFHHSIVYIMCWLCLKNNFFGYNVILIGAINCSVHVLLYTYYALAALGPSVRKYLWWKRYLTRIQIMQFFVLMLYMLFSFATGCENFGSFEKVYFTCLVIITALFFNFYKQEYKRK